jgi:hypothetical protein
MENTNRSLFGIDGIVGMLIATVLLLGILVYLTILAIGAQQGNADNFYELKDPKGIKMISTSNGAHWVDVKDGK